MTSSTKNPKYKTEKMFLF